jgi:hypothetical protein
VIRTAERELQKAILVHNTRVSYSQHALREARHLEKLRIAEAESWCVSHLVSNCDCDLCIT